MAEENNENESFLTPSRRSYVYETSRGNDNPNKKRLIIIITGIVVLVLLIVVAVAATGGKGEQNLKSKNNIPTVTPTLLPSDTPSPTGTNGTVTPTGKVTVTPTTTGANTANKNLSIAVQNGSGIAGAANKAADYLKGLGYTIVSSGNADNFNYENTVIEIKASKASYLNQLKKDLSANYSVGSTSATLSGVSADALIIIGKK